MQVLFYFYSFVFMISASIVLHDTYAHSMLTDKLPWIFILLRLIGLSGLIIAQGKGLESLALLLCVIFFGLQYMYVQELVGQNYEEFLYFGLIRAVNSYILFVSSKNMMELKR